MAPTIQLDHYYGRKVVGVTTDDGEWTIELEGSVAIINYDENYEMPDDTLVDLIFQKGVFDNESTKLYFGTDDNPAGTVVNLNPMEYGISDPERSEAPMRPQEGGVPSPADSLPPEPTERLTEVEPDAAVAAEEGEPEEDGT